MLDNFACFVCGGESILKTIIFKTSKLDRGSYSSAHVLLNSLNNLEKRDKMRGLKSILFLFHNEFNLFNNRGA